MIACSPEGSLCCDDIHARTPAPPTRALLLEPGATLRTALADRGGRDRRSHRRLALVERRSQSIGAKDLDRLRVPRPRGRNADRRQLARLQSEKHLLPRLPRRHRQHAARCGDRHRIGDRGRHARRHRAAVVELAAVTPCRCLCRSAARPAAAAAIAVLVRADAGPSRGARGVEADRGRLPLQSRLGAAIDSDR